MLYRSGAALRCDSVNCKSSVIETDQLGDSPLVRCTIDNMVLVADEDQNPAMTKRESAMTKTGEVTKLLLRLRGEKEIAARLFPLVYCELRRVAAHMMQGERAGHTLQPTAVVHEAYMRLVAGVHPTLENRAHFFALAARAMRQVLVDHARRKLAGKRVGEQVELEDNVALTQQQSEELLTLHESLERLQELDPRQAQVVEMHYFAGNAVEEIASALGIGERTVKRELQFARLFLKQQLEGKGMKLP